MEQNKNLPIVHGRNGIHYLLLVLVNYTRTVFMFSRCITAMSVLNFKLAVYSEFTAGVRCANKILS